MLFIAYTENTATYSHRMKPKHLSPLATSPTVQSQAPLLTCGSCWTAAHGINSSSNSWRPYSHPNTQWFISQLELTVYSTGTLERIRNFTIPKSFI
jgi:hypothetical protein